MHIKLLAGIAVAALAWSAAPASAQLRDTQQGMGPKELFNDDSENMHVRCQIDVDRNGVSHLYRASFVVVDRQLTLPPEGNAAIVTAFAVPAQTRFAAGTSEGRMRGKPGLLETSVYNDTRGTNASTSYNLNFALDLPDAASPYPLVSRVFLNGQPIWYSGMHQPRPGTAHYDISRKDLLGADAAPLQGTLSYVFEREGVRVAEVAFDASTLEARQVLESETTPLLNRFYDRTSTPPRGCR